MEPFFDIVLFGRFFRDAADISAVDSCCRRMERQLKNECLDENAANPHGGTNGSKVLEPETFVLIDVG